ncbi:hypothetical protein E2C01_006243 [Portunus trituberculatus]|uniref:Uncharacterized protein n=1 Tax=Portunus trituberculatus TaxID=210409 RepID=A0A5B7CWL3_PORTR|nr:hypothetical protein [Portunus trituberculatus]
MFQARQTVRASLQVARQTLVTQGFLSSIIIPLSLGALLNDRSSSPERPSGAHRSRTYKYDAPQQGRQDPGVGLSGAHGRGAPRRPPLAEATCPAVRPPRRPPGRVRQPVHGGGKRKHSTAPPTLYAAAAVAVTTRARRTAQSDGSLVHAPRASRRPAPSRRDVQHPLTDPMTFDWTG